MIDTVKPKRLTVSERGPAGSYIIVPVARIAEVREVLDSQNVPYYVDEITISLDGKPPVVFVNLNRKVDPLEVQTLLDARL